MWISKLRLSSLNSGPVANLELTTLLRKSDVDDFTSTSQRTAILCYHRATQV